MPEGVTVGVLHTGRSYADDLLPEGIVYHYPHTGAQGRDAQEVAATKAAKQLGLPLFVVVQPDSTSRRIAHLGWVEDWDDEGELFLITFGESPPAPAPAQQDEDDAPFELERSGPAGKKTSTLSRPGQHRFSFLVLRRYGAQCAVCDVSVMGLLDAAHLRAYREGGSDDASNGLVLCATHHRASIRPCSALIRRRYKSCTARALRMASSSASRGHPLPTSVPNLTRRRWSGAGRGSTRPARWSSPSRTFRRDSSGRTRSVGGNRSPSRADAAGSLGCGPHGRGLDHVSRRRNDAQSCPSPI